MTTHLSNELAQNLSANPQVKLVSADDRKLLEEKLVRLLGVKNTLARWWWQETSKTPFVINYGQDTDAFISFPNALKRIDEAVTIFVTDDKQAPWPCFQLSLTVFIEAVQSSPFAEFIIMSSDQTWALLDTHNNQILLYGSITLGD